MTITMTELHSPTPNRFRIFSVNFFGTEITTTVTPTPAVARDWIRATIHQNRDSMGRLVVGIGVQWVPNCYSGKDSPAATLQLCVGDRCLIFQLEHADDVPNILRRFLVHDGNTFVGIWNGTDAHKLTASRHGLEVKDLIDLRYYVNGSYGESLVQAPFEVIVSECLGFGGVRLEKRISMSDWDEYWLDHEQILQACVDAYVSFKIGMCIQAWEISSDDDDDDDEYDYDDYDEF